MKAKKQNRNIENDKLTIEDVIELGGDQVAFCSDLARLSTVASVYYSVAVVIFTEKYRKLTQTQTLTGFIRFMVRG